MRNHGKQEMDVTCGHDGVERPRLDRDSQEWQSRANRLARDYAPTIYPCAHCSYPVAKGYCCVTCGTADPDGSMMREEAKRRLGVKP